MLLSRGLFAVGIASTLHAVQDVMRTVGEAPVLAFLVTLLGTPEAVAHCTG